MKFSSISSMWGVGLYYAVNAKYSKDYSHKHLNHPQATSTKGVKGMFLASVNLGDVANVPQSDPNRGSLKRPPNNKDSVKGNTNGSDVYIIYANKQAYPKFYVEYEYDL